MHPSPCGPRPERQVNRGLGTERGGTLIAEATAVKRILDQLASTPGATARLRPGAPRTRRKHGVTFEEAAIVFADPLALAIDDEVHAASRA